MINPDIVLREYQARTHDRAAAFYSGGVKRQLFRLSTGLGKTVIAATLSEPFPELMREGMLMIVHTDELAAQSVEKLQWANPLLSVQLEKANTQATRSADIVVTSRQTLGRTVSGRTPRLNRLLKHRKFGVVVVDEAHHVKPTGQYDQILSRLGLGTMESKYPKPGQLAYMPGRLLIGITATPNRSDGIALAHFFDEITVDYGIRFGVEEGYLCDFEMYSVRSDTTLDGVKMSGGDFQGTDLSRRINTNARNELIVTAWKQHCGGSSIAFCASVDHALQLAATFRAAGVSARAIHYQVPKDERRDLIGDFKEGRLQVLTNNMVLTEGFDAPTAKSVIMARPTKSQTLYVQIVGRGTRTNPPDIGNLATREERLARIRASDKPSVKIIDVVDSASRHSPITVPSLFGLARDFQPPQGVGVSEAAAVVEEWLEENPHMRMFMGQIKSYEDMRIISQRVDVWDLARVPEDISALSPFRWISGGDDGAGGSSYSLSIPSKPSVNIRLERDGLGRLAGVVTRAGMWDPKAKRRTPAEAHDIGPFRDLAHATQYIDGIVSRHYSNQLPLMMAQPSWGHDPATPGQINFMNKLRVPIPEGMKITKGQASMVIDAAKLLKRKQRMEKRLKRRQAAHGAVQ